ncbi:putative Endophilin-B1 [Hypsibius exemplaris]|uniref:Endophilin-B1 n=1 Tax=Hypsibius exemplaris TaxID=2072580 RepID=A0A1W0X1I0_HYPEX|nr:putative Endophilin-B1 [Hypsibius exemplaris]
MQRTEECLGQASATELQPEVQVLIDDLDVVHERNYKILYATEKMLKRNPGLTSQEYIYQIKEKKNSTRTNALIQLGNEMIFAGRQFGDGTTYGKCLLIVGRCEEELGHEELRFVTQVAMVFLTPLRHFMDNELKKSDVNYLAAGWISTALASARKKLRPRKKQAQAETILRSNQAQFERQLELTKLACEAVQREKVNQIKGLMKFVDSQLDHFRKSVTVLENIKAELLAVLKGEKGFDFEFQWPALNFDPLQPHDHPPADGTSSTLHHDVGNYPSGSLSPSPTSAVQVKAKIKDAFSGKTASEISVAEGELVTVMEMTGPSSSQHRDVEGWLLIQRATGQIGYVPRDHVQLIEDDLSSPELEQQEKSSRFAVATSAGPRTATVTFQVEPEQSETAVYSGIG